MGSEQLVECNYVYTPNPNRNCNCNCDCYHSPYPLFSPYHYPYTTIPIAPSHDHNQTHNPNPLLPRAPVGSAPLLAQAGCTPLYSAAEYGQVEVAQLLLKAGANIEGKTNVSWGEVRGGE